MTSIGRAEFEKLVEQAIDSLPPRFLRHMDNIEVVVEDEPTDEEIRSAGMEPGDVLFGLYQGVPQTKRNTWYGNVLPDRIIIYQRPIQAGSRDRREIRKEIRITLMHEIGHYFGLGEEEISEAGYE